MDVLYQSLLYLLDLDILLLLKLLFKEMVLVLLLEQQLMLMVKMLVELLILKLLTEVLDIFKEPLLSI